MQELKVHFARPCFTREDINELKNNLQAILESGQLTSGRFVRSFEDAVAKLTGIRYAVAVNSCTAALLGSLKAMRIGVGDEVIVPSNTFVATAGVVLQVGARPIFADCDLDTFNISVDAVREKISEKTRCVIAVHVGGNPCDMTELGEACRERDLSLLEDCAHSFGSSLGGQPCGSFGEAGCFSFYPTKLITTGEGGMVLTNKPELAEEIKVLRNHGRKAFGPVDVVEVGYNFRMTEIAAATGLVQLKHLPEFIEQRNRIATEYSRAITEDWHMTPQLVREGARSSFYAYSLRVNGGAPLTRDQIVHALTERGIETSVIYHPVHGQPAYSRFVDAKQRKTLQNSESLGETTLALPMYNGMNMTEVSVVTEALSEVMRPK